MVMFLHSIFCLYNYYFIAALLTYIIVLLLHIHTVCCLCAVCHGRNLVLYLYKILDCLFQLLYKFPVKVLQCSLSC
jgi:hypothetical protein